MVPNVRTWDIRSQILSPLPDSRPPTPSRTWNIDSAISHPVSGGDKALTPHNTSQDNTLRRWLESSNSSMDTRIGQLISSHFNEAISDTIHSVAFYRKSDPCAGGKYLILDISGSRALTCHKGQLRLEAINLDNPEGYISEQAQWLCTERNGFKGFKNVAEGGFLGHDVWWDFYAKASCHSLWESFTIARRGDDLYWLQILHWWTQWQVSVRYDGTGVFAERDDGTLWEFVEIASS
ncbi:dynamin family protein [Fusarium austroafricanum]|uniref:Dynamin family protein n=1 Tax=Fusarium austroafricanum TaxID=2364996 RepID=A0A8H4NUX1_9HYPO|nr:dynamin family protein [Fusarium austroafricanum]